MDIFRRTLNLVSNIAFVVCLVGYLLSANQIRGFSTLLIVGWSSFAIVAFLEAFLYHGRAKLLYMIMLVGTAVTSIGILFKLMNYPGSKELLLYGGGSTLAGCLLVFLSTQRFDSLISKSLIIGLIAMYLMKGVLIS
ncbi:MAG: hypothetical protein OHK0057_02660 [Thermoflexibacter sp.]